MSTACRINFQRKNFLVDINFLLPEKGVLGIFGDSGSGKTTLLRCIAGLETNVCGHIEVNGNVWLDENTNLSCRQRNIAYVFQEGRLFPHMTVEKNLQYGAVRCSANSDVDNSVLLDLLKIKHLLKRFPYQLSGGEKQRVAIGRALLKKPQLLLLDEPLASLDDKRKQEILPYLELLHETLKLPILYVSHDLDEMLRFCDYLLVIDKGKSKFNGSINDALISPESSLATVESAAVVLEGSVSRQEKAFDISTVHTVNGNQFQIPGLLPIGKQVRLIVFARDVSVTNVKAEQSSILNIIKGRVITVLDKKGGRVLVQINCGEDRLLSLISVKSFQLLRLAVDKDVYIQVKAVVTRGL